MEYPNNPKIKMQVPNGVPNDMSINTPQTAPSIMSKNSFSHTAMDIKEETRNTGRASKQFIVKPGVCSKQ